MAGMKRRGNKKNSSATGAPPAGFLSALEMEAPIHYLITQSRKERVSFCEKTTDEIMKRVFLDLIELADRIDNPMFTSNGLDNSAQSLATVAILAAELLEHSSLSNSFHERQLIGFEARERECWPVLLRLGGKRNKKGERCLEGADKAKAYRIRIEQGQDAATKLKYFSDRNANKFRRAAELLLHELVRWREQGAWRGTITSWAKELFTLGDLPMTTDNVEKWWAVAKRWMDEQWETNQNLFKPLIENCKSKGKSLGGDRHDLYPSEVRRTVIDLRLKEAFFALVESPDL
jgi:hypothetical protein